MDPISTEPIPVVVITVPPVPTLSLDVVVIPETPKSPVTVTPYPVVVSFSD